MNYKALIKKQGSIIALSVICLTLVTIGISYALFFQVEANTNNQIVTAGTLNVEYGSGSSAIAATELLPMSDEAALSSSTMSGTVYIQNNGTLPAKYEVKIGNDLAAFTSRNDYDSNNDVLLSHDYIRIAVLLNGNTVVEPQTLSSIEKAADDNTMYSLFSSTLDTNGTGNSTATVVLKIWLDKDAPTSVIGQFVYLKMDVTSEVEPLLTGSFTKAVMANSTLVDSIDLNNTSSTANTKLYKVSDDLGTSYVYRGNVSNNYVTFGSYNEDVTVNGVTFPSNTSMKWRILRINGDGTIRLIYDGNLGTYAFHNNGDNKRYVGYMYEGGDTPYNNTTNSNIKTLIDEWYEKSLKNSYSKYIADEIFCNDREELETASSYLYYAASGRTTIPTLVCSQANDKFTVNDLIGNGSLSYPVGLITQDEAVYAGFNGFLTNGMGNTTSAVDRILTLTPNKVSENGSNVYLSTISKSGILDSYYDGLVRPVINIKGDVSFTGTGTSADPYVITTNN